jgi:cytoskeletal protein CcmA (bactofilin family)
MSIFGSNFQRPEPKNLSEPLDLSPRGESTTFLGEATDAMKEPDEPAPTVRSAFTSEPRPITQTSAPTPPEKCVNVIAAGAKWKGTLTVEDSVRVDGNFAGEIHAKGTVHVAEGAILDAKVRSSFVVIAGTFQGEIRCEQRVEFLPHSRVNGEVITKSLSVHEGATFDGRVQMTEVEAPRAARASAGAAATAESEAAIEERRAAPTRNGRSS